MGRFDTTKATINANIKKNGNQEITGSILNSVMTEMVDATDAELATLSAETSELNGIIDSVIERGEQSINLFEPTIIGKFYTLYGNEQTNSEAKCQVIKVASGDVLRIYFWQTSSSAYQSAQMAYVTAYSNGVAVAASGKTNINEYVVPNGIDEVRVAIISSQAAEKFCLTKNIAEIPTKQVFFGITTSKIITDKTLTLPNVPADAAAVGALINPAPLKLQPNKDYFLLDGRVNENGIIKSGDFWHSSAIAVQYGDRVTLETQYVGNGMAIGRTDANGTFYDVIYIANSEKKYILDVLFDGYISIGYIKGGYPTTFTIERNSYTEAEGSSKRYADYKGLNDVISGDASEVDATEEQSLFIKAKFDRGKMLAELSTLTEDDVLVQGSCGYSESDGDGTITWKIYKGGLLHIKGYGKMYDFIKGAEAAQTIQQVNNKVVSVHGSEYWYYGFVHGNVNGITPPFPESNQKYATDEVMIYTQKRYVPFGDEINPMNNLPYGYSAPWYIYRTYVDDTYSYDEYVQRNPLGITYNRILIEEELSKGGITYIGNWAFYRATAETLVLPNSLTHIGCWGIRFSPVMEVVVMGDNVTKIEDNGISRMEAMKAIRLSQSLQSLGYGCMAANTQLKAVRLPNVTTEVGDYAFNNNNQLTLLSLASISRVGKSMASGCAISQFVTDEIVSIDDNAFYNTKLNNVVISDKVTAINTGAFRFAPIKVVTIESESILAQLSIEVGTNADTIQCGALLSNCDWVLIPTTLPSPSFINKYFLYKGELNGYGYYKRVVDKLT